MELAPVFSGGLGLGELAPVFSEGQGWGLELAPVLAEGMGRDWDYLQFSVMDGLDEARSELLGTRKS